MKLSAKKMFPHILASLVLMMFIFPMFVYAQNESKLIVCTGTKENPCTYEKLVELVDNLISFLIKFATLVAVAGMAFAGFKLLTSGGNPKAMDEAKHIGWSIIKGYICILLAWVLISTITNAILDPEFNFIGPKS